MIDITLKNSTVENIAGRDININEISKIISIHDAILTENDEKLHEKVIFFLKEQLQFISHFSEIIHLKHDHFIQNIREIIIPSQNPTGGSNIFKEYQLALNELPTLELGNEKWYFFQNQEFIFFNNPPYALILKDINRQDVYKDGYRPNDTILSIDMLEKILMNIHQNICAFKKTIQNIRSQYSHAFYNVVRIEIENLDKDLKEWQEELILFLEPYRQKRKKVTNENEQLYNKHPNTIRMYTMEDMKSGKGCEFDEKLFLMTNDLKGVLKELFTDFSIENKGS
ncbi:hypothetical protein [Avibacterium paragallinarum]|uniref:Uncharacterized protein n=1 Tax=Avibacterium paragallinarum TaxID=728 RepID=A0AAE5TK38_AVIPA|nr:hypothetical protein [Avibacterium paragallinarum]MEE3608166.1 hypothetical protein [Avibacterium paragallinarum]MEE3621266.1 hypothetical protein [Avibacterium paragallinarum]MEE3669295.1 hypothetical protein [Avibacterium paragallinarum]MEE3681421.1 hypothetical protein [Avibacterium paragallinarum]MEE4386731.1 hypothetical protein [Avibacterium paragallinarum]